MAASLLSRVVEKFFTGEIWGIFSYFTNYESEISLLLAQFCKFIFEKSFAVRFEYKSKLLKHE
jgi:hypothetical protein